MSAVLIGLCGLVGAGPALAHPDTETYAMPVTVTPTHPAAGERVTVSSPRPPEEAVHHYGDESGINYDVYVNYQRTDGEVTEVRAVRMLRTAALNVGVEIPGDAAPGSTAEIRVALFYDGVNESAAIATTTVPVRLAASPPVAQRPAARQPTAVPEPEPASASDDDDSGAPLAVSIGGLVVLGAGVIVLLRARARSRT